MSELCGLITILSGTTLLHSTKEPDSPILTGNTSCTLLVGDFGDKNSSLFCVAITCHTGLLHNRLKLNSNLDSWEELIIFQF